MPDMVLVGGELREATPEEQAQLDADREAAALAAVRYVGSRPVSAMVRTTDDVPLVVFTFPCEQKHRYRATMTISGIDAGNFVSREMEGRFVWKRVTGNAVMVGITIVSNLGEAASSSWAPNAAPSGTDVVFTVKGAAGRTIDWELAGDIDVFAPAGLST